MLQKILGGLFVFVLVPFGMGALWTKGMDQKKDKLANIYLAGFLSELAVFQVIAVPVMLAKPYGMEFLVKLATAVLGLCALAGIGWTLLRERAVFRDKAALLKKPAQQKGGSAGSLWKRKKSGISAECILFWLLFAASVLFQLYMAYSYAYFDGDDAYYVVESVLADQTGVLNRIRPYTGLSTNPDMRHALAAFPLWIAYVARMTGIHAAIVAHTVLPLVLIPLTYYVFFLIGRRLLGARSVKLPIFMTIVSLMQIWGNSSIYTNATFFLTRTWQGKSVLANLVLLVDFWILLEIFEGFAAKREKEAASKAYAGAHRSGWGYWALLAVTNVTAAMMTSMGAFLTALLIGITGIVAAVRKKSLSVLWKLALCCIPNVIYLALLLVLR